MVLIHKNARTLLLSIASFMPRTVLVFQDFQQHKTQGRFFFGLQRSKYQSNDVFYVFLNKYVHVLLIHVWLCWEILGQLTPSRKDNDFVHVCIHFKVAILTLHLESPYAKLQNNVNVVTTIWWLWPMQCWGVSICMMNLYGSIVHKIWNDV